MHLKWSLLRNLIDTSTYPGAFVLAVFIIILSWIASFITTKIVLRTNWVIGKLKAKIDKTVIHYVVRVKDLLIVIIALIIYASLVPGLRALFGTLLAGAGITALVVGFAAKSTMANLISGLSLAIYRPFRIGDMVDIEGQYGIIEDITLRHTIVLTWQQKRLIIPNAKLDEMTLINYSIIDPRVLCTVEMSVSYDTDIDLARRLILEEVFKCPHRDPKGEEPIVRVISHGDFSIGLRIYVWVSNVGDMWLTRFWLFEHVKKRFDIEGVEIPFPYRTVVFKKDLPAPQKQRNRDPSVNG